MTVDVLERGNDMKIYAKTANATKEEWLEMRTKGIGGSDVSVIAGLNPFKSAFQLWMEKTGMIRPAEEENDYIHFGNVLEPIVRKEFMERTGKKVRMKKCIIQHSEYPFMLANVDGIVNEEEGPCIFEAKTASAYKEKAWQDHVPEEYQLQIQHYMAVTGTKKAYIAALIGGNKFVYHMVPRDEELIGLIIEMERQFWECNVMQNNPPEIDGSSATAAYLDSMYKHGVKKTVTLPEEAKQIIASYRKTAEAIKELERIKNEAENRLKAYLKDSEEGVIDDQIVRWTTVMKEKFDQKRFKSEMKDIYDRFMSETCYRRFSVEILKRSEDEAEIAERIGA